MQSHCLFYVKRADVENAREHCKQDLWSHEYSLEDNLKRAAKIMEKRIIQGMRWSKSQKMYVPINLGVGLNHYYILDKDGEMHIYEPKDVCEVDDFSELSLVSGSQISRGRLQWEESKKQKKGEQQSWWEWMGFN